ncbi:MAG: hypothetical protein AB1489_37115 [Acidobacteriota bacterium]
MSKNYLCLLIGIFALVLGATPVLAKDHWITLKTKNFTVISNAEEKKTIELALKLEQFRYIFSQIYPDTPATEPVPVTVYIFKDDGAFKPFKPTYQGKRRNDIGGYFQSGTDENIIAFNSSVAALQFIFHEYTHLITSYSTIELPPWINEGLAELYSTFEIEKDQAVLGSPIAHHVHNLRNSDLPLLPLQKLINADTKSPLYNESDKATLFYAQSWAFIHYLMLGDQGAHKPQLFRYIKLLKKGTSPDQAFVEAFQTNFEKMAQELRLYTAKSLYPIVKYRLDSTLSEKNFNLQPLTEAQTELYLGNLLLHSNRVEEAEKRFQRAVALDESLSLAIEKLATVALRRENFTQAKDLFRQALTRGTINYLVHYQLAEALYQEAGKQRTLDNIAIETAQTIIDNAKAALKLKPEFAPAYHLLALAQLASGINYAEGIEAAQAATMMAPRKKEYLFTLVRLQMQQHNYIAALKTLEPLLSSDNPDLKNTALALKQMIEEKIQANKETVAPQSK